MAFTARVETSVTSAFGGTETLNVPADTANGDILFAWICVYNNTLTTAPDGWIVISTHTNGTEKYYLYYKIALSEPASYQWVVGSTAHLVGSCYTGGDFDASAPIDTFSTLEYHTSNNDLKAEMTVTAANSPLVFFAGCFRASATTYSTPTGTDPVPTEDYDGGGGSLYLGIYSTTWSSSGALSFNVTASAALTTKHCFAVALNTPGAQSSILII